MQAARSLTSNGGNGPQSLRFSTYGSVVRVLDIEIFYSQTLDVVECIILLSGKNRVPSRSDGEDASFSGVNFPPSLPFQRLEDIKIERQTFFPSESCSRVPQRRLRFSTECFSFDQLHCFFHQHKSSSRDHINLRPIELLFKTHLSVCFHAACHQRGKADPPPSTTFFSSTISEVDITAK